MSIRKPAASMLGAGALVTVSVLGATGTASAATAAGTVEGCPSGYVCIYPQDAGWNGGHPSLKYYTYGAHNLSNQYGVHRIFNNQTGGAKMHTCKGSGGTQCDSGYLPAGDYMDKNLTPINSIVLQP
ncbi:hypothetical protein [Streptomyces sp. AF1B]|jgi:hypothetical protein|uniref:hypothetical protein n=1 Tax=Streptomyces sp. AF1B TaxID=3399503 RepID=UPI003AAC8935